MWQVCFCFYLELDLVDAVRLRRCSPQPPARHCRRVMNGEHNLDKSCENSRPESADVKGKQEHGQV